MCTCIHYYTMSALQLSKTQFTHWGFPILIYGRINTMFQLNNSGNIRLISSSFSSDFHTCTLWLKLFLKVQIISLIWHRPAGLDRRDPAEVSVCLLLCRAFFGCCCSCCLQQTYCNKKNTIRRKGYQRIHAHQQYLIFPVSASLFVSFLCLFKKHHGAVSITCTRISTSLQSSSYWKLGNNTRCVWAIVSCKLRSSFLVTFTFQELLSVHRFIAERHCWLPKHLSGAMGLISVISGTVVMSWSHSQSIWRNNRR